MASYKSLFWALLLFFAGLNALVDEEIEQKIMDFDMQDILEKYEENIPRYASDRQSPKVIEKELKRYLTLCSQGSCPRMFSEKVDDLWHLFILNTERYQQFCDEAVGSFIHHKIPSKSEQKKRDIPKEKQDFINRYKETFGETPSEEVWNLLKKRIKVLDIYGWQC